MKVSSKALALLLTLPTTSTVYAARIPFVSTHLLVHQPSNNNNNNNKIPANNAFVRSLFSLRGGDESTETETDEAIVTAETNEDKEEEEESLEDKVHAAMRRLGLSPDGSPASDASDSSDTATAGSDAEAEGGEEISNAP